MFRKGFLAALLLAASMSAYSDGRVVLGGWSHHVPSSESVTNETHKILGIEYGSWAAGYFENSYGRDTYFISKVWRYPLTENVSWAVSGGLMRGYRGCFQADDGGNADVCPYGYISIEYNKYLVVPTIKVAPGVVVFSPEIKF